MALTEKLVAIGDAIREKTGKEDKLTLDQMPNEIAEIETGGEIPEDVLTITGDCSYRFAYNGWNNFINKLGSKIKTKEISQGAAMFYESDELAEIPFDLNFSGGTMSIMFYDCRSLKKLPKVSGVLADETTFYQMFYRCCLLKEIPDDWLDNVTFSTLKSSPNPFSNVKDCYVIRSYPFKWFAKSPSPSSYTYYPWYNNFQSLYSLDEIKNIPLTFITSSITANSFYYSFQYLNHLKDFTFEVNDDGSPIKIQWRSQTINLTKTIGYMNSATALYYSTYWDPLQEKKVSDDATYQTLKDDPDWYTTNIAYSRYNHDSAVRTINSLPDTSEYLASLDSGTNTIIFSGTSGSATDGGAINTLTEEEIAVATEKGWTVTIA